MLQFELIIISNSLTPFRNIVICSHVINRNKRKRFINSFVCSFTWAIAARILKQHAIGTCLFLATYCTPIECYNGTRLIWARAKFKHYEIHTVIYHFPDSILWSKQNILCIEGKKKYFHSIHYWRSMYE